MTGNCINLYSNKRTGDKVDAMKEIILLIYLKVTFCCNYVHWNPFINKSPHVAALILARGGSKGIPLKNLAQIQGKSLLNISLNAVINSKGFDSNWISTDNQLIANEAEKVNVHWRTPETATDDATSVFAVQEFLTVHKGVDIVALIQCTSPFIKSKYIERALILLHSGYECVFSVTRSFQLRWIENDNAVVPLNFVLNRRPRRQDWNGELVENGMFYFASRKLIESGYLQNRRFEEIPK